MEEDTGLEHFEMPDDDPGTRWACPPCEQWITPSGFRALIAASVRRKVSSLCRVRMSCGGFSPKFSLIYEPGASDTLQINQKTLN